MYCRYYTGTVSRVLCREVAILCPYIWESPLSEVPLYIIHVNTVRPPP